MESHNIKYYEVMVHTNAQMSIECRLGTRDRRRKYALMCIKHTSTISAGSKGFRSHVTTSNNTSNTFHPFEDRCHIVTTAVPRIERKNMKGGESNEVINQSKKHPAD